MRRISFFALTATLAILPVVGGAAIPPEQVLRYHVEHARYGDIGTYSNTVEHIGDVTTVLSEAHLKVKMMGIVLLRQDAKREERWRGGRLMFFHGVTTTNGTAVELDGEARGNGFVITSPHGTTTAPADIHPNNPWSANFIGSDLMMRVDDGALEPVRISRGTETNIVVEGTPQLTRQYDIDGKDRYTIWLTEAAEVPVMFSVDGENGQVTFTLAK